MTKSLDTTINVTKVRLRQISSNNIIAIASVTLNEELIINDIRVCNENGHIQIKLPNSEYAKSNNQYSIIPQSTLFKKIRCAIINNLEPVQAVGR